MTRNFPLLESGRDGGNCESKVILELKQRGIDNASREWLLEHGHGAIALLIDALSRVWEVGRYFTFKQAQQQLQAFGIGHRTLRVALNYAPQGKRLFSLAGVLKSRVGRPAQLYELPGAAEVAQRIRLHRSPSDYLPVAALRGGLSAYRAALHREFIKRAPGVYPRSFLARRLGISKRTSRTYDKIERITVTPNEDRERLFKPATFDMAADGQEAFHFKWLEFEGKKYPAARTIALKFLAEKKEVYLVTQKANRYEVTYTQ